MLTRKQKWKPRTEEEIDQLHVKREYAMKNIGSIAVVFGFLLWFGGELINIVPYNIIGIPILAIGALLYFAGRRTKGKDSS